jgi:hypothetical protein
MIRKPVLLSDIITVRNKITQGFLMSCSASPEEVRRVGITTLAEFWGDFTKLRWAGDCKQTCLAIKMRAATLERKGQFKAVPGAG